MFEKQFAPMRRENTAYSSPVIDRSPSSVAGSCGVRPKRNVESARVTADSLWSVDLFRRESIVLQSYWVLVVMDQFTRRLVGVGVHAVGSLALTSAACSTRPLMAAAHREISVPTITTVRGAPMDGEPSDSGDRRNQDRALCAAVTPIRGAPDRDDATTFSTMYCYGTPVILNESSPTFRPTTMRHAATRHWRDTRR
jgi:transposase InsO family protein